MTAKTNMSKRNIVIFSSLSLMVALSCLFYVVNYNSATSYTSYTASPYISNFSAIANNSRPTYNSTKFLQCYANTAAPLHVTKKEWEQCLDAGRKPEYYLSIVIVTRMDDYAGNQHHRFQNLIDSTYLLAEHSEQKIELLIVEWNPPPNKRRVLDTFRFRGSEYLNHRIITVSDKIHKILPNIGNTPLHEFEGKNVGIRFARGEYIVCTNQADIWSHSFINAIKSKVFEKNTIYTQFQSFHNIHENLPPSIVNLEPFPNDETLYNACKSSNQDWGNYKLPNPVPKPMISHENYWFYADQARDFTMAHRDTWKECRGYRETGSVAWMDIEFILTAIGQFGKKLVYSGEFFACHQEHPNEREKNKDRHTKLQDQKSIDNLISGKKKLSNKKEQWGLQNIDIWEQGLECRDFHGGLCW